MENSFAMDTEPEEKVKDDHEITHEELHTYYRAAPGQLRNTGQGALGTFDGQIRQV